MTAVMIEMPASASWDAVSTVYGAPQQPGLLEKFSMNKDGTVFSGTIRKGLKWSDGEALTCDDFKYAHEWVMNPENVGVITTGYDIAETECVSDTTMVQHFSEIFEGYITLNVAPLPRHYLEAIPMADQTAGATRASLPA